MSTARLGDLPLDRDSCAERRAAWASGTTLAERERALAAVMRRQLAGPEPEAADTIQPREDYL